MQVYRLYVLPTCLQIKPAHWVNYLNIRGCLAAFIDRFEENGERIGE